MTESVSLRQKLLRQRGATLVFVAILLVALVAFVALAVDIGYAMVTKNELQNVADAAALAGARKLGSIYEPMTMAQQSGYVCDRATITPSLIEVASQNKAGNLSISVLDADILIGDWVPQTKAWTTTSNQPDAVSVTVRRDSLANGPVSTFFANVIGIESVAISATATAALTGASAVDPGDLIPVGLSKDWFDSTPQFCGQPIKFNPSNAAQGCAGWNTFENRPPNDAKLRNDILIPWLGGGFTSPGAQIGVSFEFIGGNLSNNTFLDFTNLFNYMKTRDGDGNDDTWSAYVAVYDNGAGCGNPNSNLPIVGFAAAKITSIVPAPDKTINAEVICNYVQPGRGGGGEYGVMGAIPGLVR